MGRTFVGPGPPLGRKHQPDQVSYSIALAHERFPPDDLLRQAVEAEQAGFDGICCSDHLAPRCTDETAPRAPAAPGCGSAPPLMRPTTPGWVAASRRSSTATTLSSSLR